MVKRKYLKNYCIKSIFLITAILSFAMCINKEQSNQYYNSMIDTSFFHTPFVAMNVSYKHAIYQIVIEENSIDLLPKSILSEKKYRYELYPMFRNDTLDVDSVAFSKLTEKGYLVKAQARINSVYDGKAKNILSSFFNKNEVLIDSLSEEEQIYIIYLLFQHNMYLKTDCETGLLHIID